MFVNMLSVSPDLTTELVAATPPDSTNKLHDFEICWVRRNFAKQFWQVLNHL